MLNAVREEFTYEFPVERLQLSSSTLKTHVLIALKAPHSSMDDLVTKALESVWNHHSNLRQSITDFQQQFKWHIGQIQHKGWHQLKVDYGNKMLTPYDGYSFQSFRSEANTFVDNLTCQVGKVLGLSDARWVTFGTVGYNSDVDTNIKLTCTPVDIEETALYKTLRDVVHYATFQGFSGPQLDTESYIPHAGEIDLAKYLSSTNAKMCFQTGEKACVIFQRVISLANLSHIYEASKKTDLASITDDAERRAVTILYASVEGFMTSLKNKIETCRNATIDLTEAKNLTYIPLRLKLGELAAKQQCKIGKSEAKDVIDRLYLELQSTLILLTILQNEGTFSAAEGKATILQPGGQLHTTELRRRANSTPGDVNPSRNSWDEITCKEQRNRKFSAPQASSLESFAEELANMSIGQNENIPYFENPTAQTNLIASEEQLVQLEHVIHEGLTNLSAGLTVIKSGKYALRTCKNLLLAVEECKKESKNPLAIVALAKKIKEYVKKCESLEKCKRKTAISTDAATALLTDAVEDHIFRKGNIDHTLVATKVKSLFSRFDFGGDAQLEVFEPSKHYESLKKLLATTEGLKVDLDNDYFDGNLKCRINSILEARAGFDRLLPEFAHLNSIHDEAAAITIETLQLSTSEAVLEFLADIIDLGTKTRAVAREMGLLPHTTEEMVSKYNFIDVLANL